MASYSSFASYLYGGYIRATMSLSKSPLSSDFRLSIRSCWTSPCLSHKKPQRFSFLPSFYPHGLQLWSWVTSLCWQFIRKGPGGWKRHLTPKWILSRSFHFLCSPVSSFPQVIILQQSREDKHLPPTCFRQGAEPGAEGLELSEGYNQYPKPTHAHTHRTSAESGVQSV